MARTIRLGVAGAVLMATSIFAQAEDWQAMEPADLAGLTVQYERAEQRFGETGKTLYDAGRPEWGNWRSADGQYCSQWPPRTEWTCYSVERSGDRIRFVGPGGDVSVGVLK